MIQEEASAESSSSRSSLSSTTTTTSTAAAADPAIYMPQSLDEMVSQASSAIKEASKRGQKLQIIRVLLPRDATSGDLGVYVENPSAAEGESADSSIKLVPPDESWQGGIMQLYRPASSTCSSILRQVTKNKPSGLPPRINEDRTVDESGVDGIGLYTADDDSISCWVQPTQEVAEDRIIPIATEEMNKEDSEQIIVLMNPQWRIVKDALDTYSEGDGFLANVASFLGGKGNVQKQLSNVGFTPVYTLEGYICRGNNVRLLQVLDSDWQIYYEQERQDDDGRGRTTTETYIFVGSTPNRPSYQDVDEMLQNAHVGFKFARDFGLSSSSDSKDQK